MRRIRLRVAYDGTAYCGWQVQPEVPTIEGELNQAISRLTKEEIIVIGASRTDAGVHAKGNVAVFDTESTIPADRFAYALNPLLPEDIVVVASDEVFFLLTDFDCDLIIEVQGSNRAVNRPNDRS